MQYSELRTDLRRALVLQSVEPLRVGINFRPGKICPGQLGVRNDLIRSSVCMVLYKQ